MARETKEDVATMLRSVLSSEKNGVPLRVLEHEYKVLIGTRIPYRNMGYDTLEAFLGSLPDVVRFSRGPSGELIAKAVVTESTLHVAQMVAGQKSTKSKPVVRSAYRHPISRRRPGYRPINIGIREHGHPVSSSRLPPRGSGIRGVYEPRRSVGTARGNQREYSPHRPALNKNGSNATRRSSFEVPPRFQKSQSSSDNDRCSPDSWEDATSKHSTSNKQDDTTWGSSRARWDCSGSGTGWDSAGKVDSGNDWERLDCGWGEPSRDSAPGSQSSKEDDASKSIAEWVCETKREAVTKNCSNASASQWATWGASNGVTSVGQGFSCDVPPESIKRTVTFSRGESDWESQAVVAATTQGGKDNHEGGQKATGGKQCRTPTIEPDQPRFDPFRKGILLREAAGAPQAQEQDGKAHLLETLSKAQTVPPPIPITLPAAVETTAFATARSPPMVRTVPGHARPLVLTLPTSPSVVPATPSPVWTPPLVSPSKPLPEGNEPDPETPFRKLVAQHASKHGLTPVYSALRSRSAKRGPVMWLATLKLDTRSYNSYPNEKATEEEALEEAARKAVLALDLSSGTYAELPVTPASTNEEITVLQNRIAELVATKPRGLLNTSVPDLYKERFRETLPDSWLCHVATTSRVDVAEIDGNRCILYPQGTTAPSVPSQSGHAPAQPPASANNKLPEHEQRDEYVDVFITCITSTDSVCFRFIEYAEEYDLLTEEMNRFYSSGQQRPAGHLQAGELYATCVGGAWLRVQLVSSQQQQDAKVESYFVDQGDTEAVEVADLYCLEPRFKELPLQAIQCQLDGLEEYSVCDRAVDVLVELLLGKTLVAEVVQKEDPVTVVLYDTWTEVDVNLNLEVAVRLAEPLLPRPGCIGRVQLCHVAPSGEIYLQILGPGLDSLTQSMEIVNQYYENNTDPVGRLESGRLYTCRYSGDRRFYRVMLQSTEPQMSGKFSVLYVDYGNEDSVFMAELRDLDVFGDVVMRLPHQAVQCRLNGVLDGAGESWTELATSKLWEAVADSSELLVKTMKPASRKEVASVALFRRIEPNKELITINTALSLSLCSTQGARS